MVEDKRIYYEDGKKIYILDGSERIGRYRIDESTNRRPSTMGQTVELSFCQTDKLRERDISSNGNKLLNMCCVGNKRARVHVCPSTVLNSMNEFIKLLYPLVWPRNPQSHDNNHEFDQWGKKKKKERGGRNNFEIVLKSIGKLEKKQSLKNKDFHFDNHFE